MATKDLIPETISEVATDKETRTKSILSPAPGPAIKTRRWLRRLKKTLLYTAISLIAFYFVGRLVWRFSGSNQWELYGDKNGVKIYTLKQPGSDLRKFKSVFRIHAALGSLIKYMQDPDACNDVGCINAYEIERQDDRLQYGYFAYKLPFPFQAREMVVRQQFYQEPKTKIVLAEYVAYPDKLPPNDCCFRVTTMNNTWRITPLGNNEVQIEYVLDMDMGGFIPDILSNTSRPNLLFLFPKLEEWVNRPKYKDAKFDWIQEK